MITDGVVSIQDINDACIIFYRAHANVEPTRMIVSEGVLQQLRFMAHTGPNGWDYGERTVETMTWEGIKIEIDKSLTGLSVRFDV